MMSSEDVEGSLFAFSVKLDHISKWLQSVLQAENRTSTFPPLLLVPLKSSTKIFRKLLEVGFSGKFSGSIRYLLLDSD
jgi:hypothetical protein